MSPSKSNSTSQAAAPPVKPQIVSSPADDFAAFVDNMTAALEAATSSASEFPDKSDLSFHRTLDRKFAKGIDASGERMISMVDRLLQLTVEAQPKSKDLGRVKPRRKLGDEDDVVDHFQSSVVDHLESLLEDADTNLDEVNGQRKKAAIKTNPNAMVMEKLPGPSSSSGRLASNLLLNTKLEKPQLRFKDPINNSADQPPWRPTLKEKAHAMVPIGFKNPPEPELEHESMEEDDSELQNDQAVKAKERAKARRQKLNLARLHHPYYFETRNLPYPTSLFTEREPIEPKSFEATPFQFVDTPEQLEALTAELLQAKEIAFDLEHHSTITYAGFVCLMQVSTRDGDWVVDTLALRSELREHKLGGVLADPSVVKVFHGADSDIVWLQQDFDIYVVNLFDTFHAAKALDFPQLSLAGLLKVYCDFNADKRYQTADWRIRPLPQEMMHYARADTHFLLYVYDRLRNSLIARSSRTPSPAVDAGDNDVSTSKPNPQRAIRKVLDNSAETALSLYSRPVYDLERGTGMGGWASMSRKWMSPSQMDGKIGQVLKSLHHWRDTLARELDLSPVYLFPNSTLSMIARTLQTRPEVLKRTLSKSAPLVADRVDEIRAVIEQATRAQAGHDTLAPPTAAPSGTPAKSARPAAPATPAQEDSVPAAKKPKTHIPVDMWADLIASKPKKASPAKARATSALFGRTLSTKVAGASTSSASGPSSSLFGHVLDKPSSTDSTRSSRQVSPGFASIQSTIHSSLQKAPLDVPTSDPAVPNPGAEPETVAFVPAGERKIAKSELATTTASSTKARASAEPTPVPAVPKTGPAVDADGVVSVRKQKKSKQEKALAKAESQSAATSAEGSPVPGPTKKKDKIKPSDIPAFDYAAEANLLDQPTSSSADKTASKKGKKKDKAKRKKASTSASGNRRPPVNPSEPKSGNKSGTFA